MGTIRKPATKPTIASGTMRAKVWPLLSSCVENGVRYGWTRAHKHTDTPTEEDAIAAIEGAVMNEIAEWFSFPDDEFNC